MGKWNKKATELRDAAESWGEDSEYYYELHSAADEFDCVGTDKEQLEYAKEDLAMIPAKYRKVKK